MVDFTAFSSDSRSSDYHCVSTCCLRFTYERSNTMPKITDTACKNAPVDAKLWDSEVKWFAMFAGKTRKTFFFQRDVNGKTVRDKIGLWGEINAAQARTEATMLAADHASGTVAKRLRAARTPTLNEALSTYIARPKLRSDQNKEIVEGQMLMNLKDWLDTPLDQIDRAICARAHARLTAPREGRDVKGRTRMLGGEGAANHTRSRSGRFGTMFGAPMTCPNAPRSRLNGTTRNRRKR